MAKKNFYLHVDFRVDIQADSAEEAKQLWESSDVGIKPYSKKDRKDISIAYVDDIGDLEEEA